MLAKPDSTKGFLRHLYWGVVVGMEVGLTKESWRSQREIFCHMTIGHKNKVPRFCKGLGMEQPAMGALNCVSHFE